MSTDQNGAEVIVAKRGNLSPQQRIAAAMVAAGRNDAEIAEEVGVAVSTVATWRKRPQFMAEVNKVLDQVAKNIVRRAYAAVPQAVEYLISVLSDPTASHTQRIQAAKILLDRFPEFTPERAAEPVPDAPRQLPAVPVGPDGKPIAQRPAEETLLEIYKAMAQIEDARARQPVPLVDYADEEDDDPRTIVGELAEDDDVPVNEPEPVVRREIKRRPKVTTTEADEAELKRMARSRGAGPGGSRAYYAN